MEIDGSAQSICLRKTWWDGVNEDIKSFGLSQEDAQDQEKWRGKVRIQDRYALIYFILCIF